MKLISTIAAICAAAICSSADLEPAAAHGHGGRGHCHSGCHGGRRHQGGRGFDNGIRNYYQTSYIGWNQSSMAGGMGGGCRHHHHLTSMYSWPNSNSSMINMTGNPISATSMPPLGTRILPGEFGSSQQTYGTMGGAQDIPNMNSDDPYIMNMMATARRRRQQYQSQNYGNGMPNYQGQSGNGWASMNGAPSNGSASVSGRLNNGWGSVNDEPSYGGNRPAQSGLF